MKRIETCAELLALWAKQIEECEKNNPAIGFVREMQIASQYVAALIVLGLYKPAAAGMRTVAETMLYFTYFRHHPIELRTLVRRDSYYVSKAEIVDYHVKHSATFSKCQNALNLKDRFDKWYSEISGVVHGQIPGAWVTFTAIEDVSFEVDAATAAVTNFERCVEITNDFLLCTLAQDSWVGFSGSSKARFLKGKSGSQRAALDLDSA